MLCGVRRARSCTQPLARGVKGPALLPALLQPLLQALPQPLLPAPVLALVRQPAPLLTVALSPQRAHQPKLRGLVPHHARDYSPSPLSPDPMVCVQLRSPSRLLRLYPWRHQSRVASRRGATQAWRATPHVSYARARLLG